MRILATVRHPGPAHALASFMSALPSVEWTVLAAADSLPILLQRGLKALGARIVETPPAGHEYLAPWLAREVRAADPHLVVRTTPSNGLGGDELIAAVVAGRVPVVALQDFPGVGIALGADEETSSEHPVDMVGSPDRSAMDQLALRGVPATTVGWIAHQRFVGAPPWHSMRDEARRRLRLESSDVVALVIGSSSDIAAHVDEELLLACASISVEGVGERPRVIYKRHPRRSDADIRRLNTLVAELGGVGTDAATATLSETMTLALPDLIVSRASVMNLEALAYAAGSDDEAGPLSVYCGDFSTSMFPGYWGATLPATHLPGQGSIIADLGTVGAAVGLALSDDEERARIRRTAASRYGPSATVANDLRSLVRSVGVDLT